MLGHWSSAPLRDIERTALDRRRPVNETGDLWNRVEPLPRYCIAFPPFEAKVVQLVGDGRMCSLWTGHRNIITKPDGGHLERKSGVGVVLARVSPICRFVTTG